MTARISHTYDELWPEGAPHVLTHFGGEFVAGSTVRLQDLWSMPHVFDRMQQTGVRSQDGDEANFGCCGLPQPAGGQARAGRQRVCVPVLAGRALFIMFPRTTAATPSACCTCPARRKCAS